MPPHFKFIFVLSNHFTAEDARPVAQAIQHYKPHAVSIENSTQRESRRKIDEAVWNHGGGTKGWASHEFKIEVLDVMARHRIPFKQLEFYPDQIATNRARIHSGAIEPAGTEAGEAICRGDLAAALAVQRRILELRRKTNEGRHEQMVANANVIAKEILEEHPELGRESEIRILVQIGRAHKDIAKDFRRAGLDAEVVHTHWPYVPAPYSGITLLKSPIDDELVGHATIFTMLQNHFSNIPTNSTKIELVAESIARTVSQKDLPQLFQRLAEMAKRFKNAKMDFNVPDALTVMGEWFRGRGITVPESKEELEAYSKKLAPDSKFGLFSEKEMEKKS